MAQRFEGVVHRELFHAVDEDEAVAFLRAHDVLDVKARGALNLHRVEMHVGLRIEAGHVLVAAGLERRKARVVEAVRHVRHHGVGNVADAAEARHFKREFLRGNVDAHAALEDRLHGFRAQTEHVVIHFLRGKVHFLRNPSTAGRCRRRSVL